MKTRIGWLGVMLVLFHAGRLPAEDWPTHRHDINRSGITADVPGLPLRLAWHHAAAQPPSPAWPPPHVIMFNRLDFDYAPQPVVGAGVVCFGSSTDDTVRALDERTGELRWQLTTGGPVRVAPQIAGGLAYFGSDDGVAYCVEAATGRLLWSFRAAPQADQCIGNDRMISRWPIRTGVLVDEGVAYCVAGMWANEGIYVWALEAATGKVLWCNDTSGFAGVDYNHLMNPTNAVNLEHGVHDGDFGVYGLTPQGALAANRDVLLVPNGYAMPAGFDRRTGRLLFAEPRAGEGGHSVIVDGDKFHISSIHRAGTLGLRSHRMTDGQFVTFLRGEIPQISPLPARPPVQGRPPIKQERGKPSVLVHQGKMVGRNAFSLVMAGGKLVLGLAGAVAVVDPATNTELWRGSVEGEVRELAVANGQIIAATTRGGVYCFAPAANAPAPRLHSPPALQAPPPAPATFAPLLARLRETGMDRGFALVLGDDAGRLLRPLADQTQLRTIAVVRNAATAAALRGQLLAETAQYGSRVQVQAAERKDHLPFAQYFANAIIVSGPLSGWSPRDLYRMLRPCGGMLHFTDADTATAAAFLRETGAPLTEIRASPAGPCLVRGRLPGALDWDSDLAADQRAKWPLRLLWFGGPSTAQVTDLKHGNARAPAAFGRYFVLGENVLTAVDAYNGRNLWTRPIPRHSLDIRVSRDLINHTELVWSQELGRNYSRYIRVTDESVFLNLGPGCFRTGQGCIELDARTGAQRRIYGPLNPAPAVALQTPQTWKLPVDEQHSGQLTLGREADGLVITLRTQDPVVTELDEWDLFFDFRPSASRYGLYDPGTFQLRVVPALDTATPASVTPGTGNAPPLVHVAGTFTTGGSLTVVRVPWAKIPGLEGRAPDSFGFAATLNSHDGQTAERIRQSHLFADAVADGINNGWANVTLADNVKIAAPTNVVGAFSAAPKVKVKAYPAKLEASVSSLLREHPLTGELGPRHFHTGTGLCGGMDFSMNSVIKRAGAAKVLGLYDFEDDSGLRTYVGISAACGPSTTVSQGLVISSEAKSRCVCNYPFRTSVVLAPAETRLHEDWAIFHERTPDTTLRQAALNLGAFGDRRSEDGTLWLAWPRPLAPHEAMGYARVPGTYDDAQRPGVWPIATSASLQFPMTVDCDPALGPYRFNADRVAIAGTQQPWIYASGYRGIRRASLQVDFLPMLKSVVFTVPPQLDGILAQREWLGPPLATLPNTKTRVWLAHDAQAIYCAATRPPIPGHRSLMPKPSRTAAPVKDVFTDDSWELFLTDAAGDKVLHLAVNGANERFQAFSANPKAPGDSSWAGAWSSVVRLDDAGFTVELAVPLATLRAAGLDPQTLAVNFQMNRTRIAGEALAYLGAAGRSRCANFAPLALGERAPAAPRQFRVALHFAEPDDVAAGQRVFDVKLQGRVVLKDFDVAREAGGPRRALVRRFEHIEAAGAMNLEFVPKTNGAGAASAPILSGWEVLEEAFALARNKPAP